MGCSVRFTRSGKTKERMLFSFCDDGLPALARNGTIAPVLANILNLFLHF
jgi:hypothetical protein